MKCSFCESEAVIELTVKYEKSGEVRHCEEHFKEFEGEKMNEAQLREQIAKDIEAKHTDRDANEFSDCWDIEYCEYICTHLADAAIARGLVG